MNVCELCGSDSRSVSAMLACIEECEKEAANTREFFRSYNPHRKD